MTPSDIRRNPDGSITMCSKNDCCPSIVFDEEGGATIFENGAEVKFDKDQICLLGQVIALHGCKLA